MGLIVRTAEQIAAEAAEQEAEVRRQKARTYLAETDWMIVRFAETGAAIPAEVVAARAEARKILP